MSIFNIIILIGIVLCFYPILKPLINGKARNEYTNKVYEKRASAIREGIEAQGGELIEINRGKIKDYPNKDELDTDDGSLYVAYKVKYRVGKVDKSTWALFNIKQKNYGMTIPTFMQSEDIKINENT